MDKSVRDLADALFMKAVLPSNAARDQEAESSIRAMASRGGRSHLATMSGLRAKFLARNLRSRLKSFQDAFSDLALTPTIEELDEIWQVVKNYYESGVQSSVHFINELSARTNSPRASATQFQSIVARDHDQVLQEWKVWRARISATQSGTFSFALRAIPPITDLPGKQVLLDDLRRILAAGQQAAVVVIDLDNFKAVNDSLGHPEGDSCLQKVNSLIGASALLKGRTYRIGGDEFALVLPNFDEAEARATAERIRESIDRANPCASVKVTSSIGIAIANRARFDSPDAAFKAADDAMYYAKRRTKNAVHVHESDAN